MLRIVEPELLDQLPPEDPRAVRSRRDLRRVNALMRSHDMMAQALRAGTNGRTPRHIIDLGAGDGDFLLRVAQRLAVGNEERFGLARQRLGLRQPSAALETHGTPSKAPEGWRSPKPCGSSDGSWKGVSASLLDRVSIVPAATLKEFEKLGWQAESVVADVFDWASGRVESRESKVESRDAAGSPRSPPDARHPAQVVVANLFLHHFSDAQLAGLFRAVSKSVNLLVAVEPRRSALPMFCSRSLRVVGCSAVTRHDAVASVRAGFIGCELSTLWPAGEEWILTEKPIGVFSQVFVAQRRRFMIYDL